MINPNATTDTSGPIQDTTRLVIVTGLSGAGKSTALNVLEDIGYEVVDNLPLVLLDGLLGLGPKTEMQDTPRQPHFLALGIDIRTRDLDATWFRGILDGLQKRPNIDVHLLFLDADDDVLIRRFTETRRRHPTKNDLPVSDGIALERRIMAPLKAVANLVVDTSRLSHNEFRSLIEERYRTDCRSRMQVTVMSFGFKNGLPREADIVLDVRFLRNPYYVDHLRTKTGEDPEVGEYVADDPALTPFLENVKTLLHPILPRYQTEGRSYLTIAVGCTGGQHRSVFTARQIHAWLTGQNYQPILRHRDISVLPSQSQTVQGSMKEIQS
ncbi:RNase adapter RapZ [Haematospirillum jordaniae]|uniref:RNase adapter RapZ n=1 Tax=Haematospirillum jordaniae TaxID=1549855 RepID=UPI001432CBDC|nr:RNase adapter RapZ [Haematospirillum jordaniae]NKD85918.1 RNase adapter RapZ [Haematospirillum jordaniae]